MDGFKNFDLNKLNELMGFAQGNIKDMFGGFEYPASGYGDSASAVNLGKNRANQNLALFQSILPIFAQQQQMNQENEWRLKLAEMQRQWQLADQETARRQEIENADRERVEFWNRYPATKAGGIGGILPTTGFNTPYQMGAEAQARYLQNQAQPPSLGYQPRAGNYSQFFNQPAKPQSQNNLLKMAQGGANMMRNQFDPTRQQNANMPKFSGIDYNIAQNARRY